jgi:hypothetical protein
MLKNWKVTLFAGLIAYVKPVLLLSNHYAITHGFFFFLHNNTGLQQKI